MKPVLTNDEMQICNEAFKKMPDQFSSRQFNKVLLFLGLDEDFIEKDKSYYYLQMNSRIIKGTRTWIKNDAKGFFDYFNDDAPVDHQQKEIEKAIELLKKTGKYKIFVQYTELKPIN